MPDNAVNAAAAKRAEKKRQRETGELISKTFKFRLVPSRPQAVMLAKHAGASRFVWNQGLAYLQQRREEKKPHVGFFTKGDGLSDWFKRLRDSEECAWLRELSSAGIRYSLRRLHTAYDAAFKRLKKGEEAGFPKFHGKRDDESFTLPQNNIFILGARGLRLEKIGWVRMRPNRGRGGCEIPGTAKMVVVKRENGRWFASIQCDIPAEPKKPHIGGAVGIDMGVINSFAFCDKNGGEFFRNLRDFSQNNGAAKPQKRRAVSDRQWEARRARYFRMVERRQAGNVGQRNGEIFEDYIRRIKAERKAKNAAARAENANAGREKTSASDKLKSETIKSLESQRTRYQTVMSHKQEAALKTVGWDGKSETRKTAEQQLGKLRKAQAAELLANLDAAETEKRLGKRRTAAAKESGFLALPKYGTRYETAKRRHAKATRKLMNIRRNALHHISSEIVRDYGMIFVEQLRIKNMSASAKGTVEEPGKNVAQKRGLNRGILEQGWGIMRGMLEYKAAWRGARVEEVSPENTSRGCRKCGKIAKDSRNGEEFKCVFCGYEKHADINAAGNILDRGLKSLTHGERASARKKREPSILQGRKKRVSSVKQTDTGNRVHSPLQSG